MPPKLQRRQYQVFIDRVPEAVFAFHTNLRNHARLCPSDMPEEVLTDPEGAELAEGARVAYRITRGGIARPFNVEVFDWTPPHGWAVRQVEGPFASWTHRQRFAPFQGGTLLTDLIEYAPPAGPLGMLIDRLYLGAQMEKLFRHRQEEAKRLIERISRIKGRDAL
ncbi:MAG TPA: SRPBCC family protein [Armatimonadaceae bacterium]|nr:SRPBCC family protein [Armatimonadaceae bacterium]